MITQPLKEQRDYAVDGCDQLEKNYIELDPSLKTDDIKKQFKDRDSKLANRILFEEESSIENIVDMVLKGDK